MPSTTSKQKKKLLFSDRLNLALDFLEYPPLHLGRIERLKDVFQVSQTAARKWITGLSLPHYERRKLIAQKLGLAFDWLEQGLGPMWPEKNVLTVQSVPAYPLYTTRDILENLDPQEYFACPGPHYVKGWVIQQLFDSTNQRFPWGCFLLIDPQSQLKEKDFLLVVVEEQISIQPFKDLHFLTQSVKIKGRVTQVIINI